MNLHNIILGENDDFLREQKAYISPRENKTTITHIVPKKFREDVNALTNYVGEVNFKSGLCMDIALSELLNIVPRKRRRTDAYNALIKYLKDERNILLTIKTNKND